jgi:hypothetical protein
MIFKELTAYSFRVDLSNNVASTAEIKTFFEKYNVIKYYGNPEIGGQTKKQHYQMIIWMKELDHNDMNKMRNYWRGKVKKVKGGGASLTIAKDETRLFGYCRKDEKNEILTNVSKEIIKSIKKFKTLKALKLDKREKLEKIIGGISQKMPYNHYLQALEEAYFSVYGRPSFRKNYYLENLRKAGYMESKHVIQMVFPHGIDCKTHANDFEFDCDYEEKYIKQYINENKKCIKKHLKKTEQDNM